MVLKLFLVVLGAMVLAMLGLATTILLKKNGEFPVTHVGSNKEMRKLGIRCAKSLDNVERSKVKKEMQFKHLRLADDIKS